MKQGERLRFCLLEYRPRGWGYVPLPPARVLILVTFDQVDGLRILTEPHLYVAVDGEDLDFLRALLANWPIYARLDVAEFFRQLQNLGVGPVMLQAEGSNLFDYPSLVELYSRFVPFE